MSDDRHLYDRPPAFSATLLQMPMTFEPSFAVIKLEALACSMVAAELAFVCKPGCMASLGLAVICPGLQPRESLVSLGDKFMRPPACRMVGGVQARMEADPAFVFKLGCECCLDLTIIMAVNIARRRDRFLKELDYVLSQV